MRLHQDSGGEPIWLVLTMDVSALPFVSRKVALRWPWQDVVAAEPSRGDQPVLRGGDPSHSTFVFLNECLDRLLPEILFASGCAKHRPGPLTKHAVVSSSGGRAAGCCGRSVRRCGAHRFAVVALAGNLLYCPSAETICPRRQRRSTAGVELGRGRVAYGTRPPGDAEPSARSTSLTAPLTSMNKTWLLCSKVANRCSAFRSAARHVELGSPLTPPVLLRCFGVSPAGELQGCNPTPARRQSRR